MHTGLETERDVRFYKFLKFLSIRVSEDCESKYVNLRIVSDYCNIWHLVWTVETSRHWHIEHTSNLRQHTKNIRLTTEPHVTSPKLVNYTERSRGTLSVDRVGLTPLAIQPPQLYRVGELRSSYSPQNPLFSRSIRSSYWSSSSGTIRENSNVCDARFGSI